MSDLTRSNRPLNAHCELSKIIPYVPLQPKINGFLAGYFYPLKSVFFRLAGTTKLAIICSMWRVQL